MNYYEVWVRSDRYRGSEALTYCLGSTVPIGSIVTVPLKQQQVAGFVSAAVKRPPFTVKPISDVLNLPPLPPTSIGLAKWLATYYASPIGVVSGQFLPGGLKPSRQLPEMQSSESSLPAKPLTADQKAALRTIDQPNTYILHGRTGSGKTRIYSELAQRAILANRSALVLSPEIGLTSQLAEQFRLLFGDRVIVLHSQLTSKEREIAWLRILTACKPFVVIGPRSALFSPIANLGLIIVDESHDQAYKQGQSPYYHAVRVASQLRLMHGAVLVLGSATPSISDYYLALQKQKPIIRIEKLAIPSTLERSITIVDLKDRTHFVRSAHISSELTEAISTSLAKGEQALLYLNRRGTARVTLCTVCGWQALCPNCDLPLAYHGDDYRLRCHTCGYNQTPVIACPSCGAKSITLKSFGTKAIVDEAQRLFPEARILRLDTDSAKTERLEQQYEQIIAGNVDILVGTQMLAKGLDLPRLSTLGIILADSSLYLPDFTARERTYQLLTQVIGRIGRGHVTSHAVIQTYYPDSQLIQAAIHDEWDTFYTAEIAEREQFLFPPFCHLLKITCRRATSLSAEKAMRTFKEELHRSGLHVQVDGPAPSFHEKASGKYQWQIVLKARDRSLLIKALQLLPKGWSYDLDPVDLL